MKRLTSKELKSLNECAYHTMSNEQLDESILGAIGKGLFSVAKGAGKATAKGAGKVATSLPGKVGRVARARAGAKAIKTQAQVQQQAAKTAQELGLRRADYAEAIRRGKANSNASADDILRLRRAERALADDKLDEVESLINPATGGVATGGSNLATGVAAGLGAAVGSSADKKDGFLSSNFREIEKAAQQGASENIFGDLKTTLALQGKATGSRINVQNRLRGIR
jgi:hypothetical protein